MSLQETKAQLLNVLADTDHRVIALSGQWGTGKSHLWKELQETSTVDAIREAPYVSLFGLKDLNDIKVRLAQSAIPTLATNPSAAKRVQSLVVVLRKLLASSRGGFAALEELALVVMAQ